MIPAARLTPGPGWQPGRALLYYLQRIVVLKPLRQLVASTIAGAIQRIHRAQLRESNPLLPALRSDGCVRLGPLLSDAAIQDMLAYLNERDVLLRDGCFVRADRVPPGQALADFPLATVVNCPHVMELANHPQVLELATAYLGCTPTISSISLRWSYPKSVGADVQQFHRDPDDWRMLKFFLYLTDVDERSGPHVFVRGTQHQSGKIFARLYGDDDIARIYGRDAMMSIIGPRGTTFVADTSGIHKGAIPSARPRLLFEVGYTLLPVYAWDYKPERLVRSCPPVDPYINRLIVAA